MAIAPVHHILPLTLIVRSRLLPAKGTVRVRKGQKVSPTDTVAEASWSREHIFIDVARTLGVSVAAADRLIRVREGQNVAPGLVLASGGGLMPRSVTAPRSARVLAAGGGQILLEAGEARLELRAGLAGTVREIVPDRGAVLQAAGVLIQGVWGNGRVENGAMIILADRPDTLLEAGRLDVSMRGSILVGGQLRDADALKAAAEVGVRGLVLGTISPILLPAASEMRFPIIATDGFGARGMNSVAFKLITTHNKREATLNAEAPNRYDGARPEVIIPLPADQLPPEPRQSQEYAPGQTVRIRRQPAVGVIGTIQHLPPGLSTFPGGMRAPGAEVKLENGQQLLVPLVNLEVVG